MENNEVKNTIASYSDCNDKIIIMTNLPTYISLRAGQCDDVPNKRFIDLSNESKENLKEIFKNSAITCATDIHIRSVDAKNSLILYDSINFSIDGVKYSEFIIAGTVIPVNCSGDFVINFGRSNNVKQYVVAMERGLVRGLKLDSVQIMQNLPFLELKDECTVEELLTALGYYVRGEFTVETSQYYCNVI